MKFLSSLSLRFKLPAIIVGMSVLTALTMGYIADRQFRDKLVESVIRTQELALASETRLLQLWFKRIEDYVESDSQNPAVVTALTQFTTAWDLKGNRAGPDLQRTYLTENPFPIGEKQKMVKGSDDSLYSTIHAQFHPFFDRAREKHGYYDIFLFDTRGNLIYSVFKEADFATNFINGPYARTGLAEAYRASSNAPSGTVSFTDFQTYAPSAGLPMAFVSAPVHDEENRLVGVLAIQLGSDRIQVAIEQSKEAVDADTAFFVGEDGLLRSSLTGPVEGGLMDRIALPDYVKQSLGSDQSLSLSTTGLQGTKVLASLSDMPIFDTHWHVVVESDLAKDLQPLTDLRRLFVMGGALAILIIALVGWWMASFFIRPLKGLQNHMKLMAQKDYSNEVLDTDRGDEFGQIAKVVSQLQESLGQADRVEARNLEKAAEQREVVEKLSTGLSALSEGSLTSVLSEPFSAEFEPLRQDFNKSVEELRHLISEVVTSCQAIHGESDEISSGADELSRRTENQAATLEQTAAALDALTANVKQSAQNAKEVEDTVTEAREKALSGKTIVDNAVNTMKEIESSSAEINEILMVIEDIAFQTKLLALNAGVEAGRAGEAGRGFAVVASEVGSLAKRSSEAAQEIKTIINSASKQVAKGVADVSETGEAISAISGRVSHISELMADFAALATEQSGSLDEINIGVNHLDQVTQQNAAMAEQSSAASHALRDKALSLSEIVGKFDLGQGPRAVTTQAAPRPPAGTTRPGTPAAKVANGAGVELFTTSTNDGVWQSY
ncbi:MAG: methyl-accepting chemotaxis protein [Sulfitobacter sp.]|nr:methyl-accepting chemotaxis protein [Sulfitobacter sp.]